MQFLGQVVKSGVNSVVALASDLIQVIDHLWIGLTKVENTGQTAGRSAIDRIERRMEWTPCPRDVRMIEKEEHNGNQKKIGEHMNGIVLNWSEMRDDLGIIPAQSVRIEETILCPLHTVLKKKNAPSSSCYVLNRQPWPTSAIDCTRVTAVNKTNVTKRLVAINCTMI